MGIEFHGDESSKQYKRTLQFLNWAFTSLFAIEMILRIAAYGPIGYFRDTMNWFDAAVVIVSLVEVGMDVDRFIKIQAARASGVRLRGGPSFNVSALRAFRLIRIFKLARSFKGLRLILRTMVVALTQARDLNVLLVQTLTLTLTLILTANPIAGARSCFPTGARHLHLRPPGHGALWRRHGHVPPSKAPQWHMVKLPPHRLGQWHADRAVGLPRLCCECLECCKLVSR